MLQQSAVKSNVGFRVHDNVERWERKSVLDETIDHLILCSVQKGFADPLSSVQPSEKLFVLEAFCAEFSLNVNFLQLLFDCSELESRLTETLNLVNTDDYGKDQLATQSLITKHQVQHTF